VMECIDPDVVVISQGNIEGSWLGLVVAKRAGLRTVSYIPMAQPLGSSGSRLVFRGRALVDRILYGVPDKFITINKSAKQMLLERGARTEIDVIPNGIELKSSPSDRASARRDFGLAEKDYVVATIGRIVFGQKAQNFLIEAIAKHRHQLHTFHFFVVGEGPDELKLRKMIRDLRLSDCVSILPWQNDLSSFYSAIDLLVIPSYFEGVPLVMLEAMWHGIPIVASDVDGMAEILPPEWLCRRGDQESLANTLLHVRQANNSQYLAAHKRRVAEEFSVASFQKHFCKAVIGTRQVTANPQAVNRERVSRLAHRN
jgi:glycosyltransferase involved in cell wall biosynthesis